MLPKYQRISSTVCFYYIDHWGNTLTIVYWFSIRCRYVVQILGLNIVHIVCFIKKLQTVQTTGRKMFILSPHFPSHKTLYIITSAYSTIHSNICILHIQYILKKRNSDLKEFRFSNKLSASWKNVTAKKMKCPMNLE